MPTVAPCCHSIYICAMQAVEHVIAVISFPSTSVYCSVCDFGMPR
jgi:hypothetical protein